MKPIIKDNYQCTNITTVWIAANFRRHSVNHSVRRSGRPFEDLLYSEVHRDRNRATIRTTVRTPATFICSQQSKAMGPGVFSLLIQEHRPCTFRYVYIVKYRIEFLGWLYCREQVSSRLEMDRIQMDLFRCGSEKY
jgi:hypothetical protein